MALDGYSLCPGGRNKKIRFCCPDMLKELEQAGNLLADEQFKACVTFIEDVEKKHPDCACLTAAKLLALRSQNQWDAFIPVAEAFYQREPENGTAISELAIARAVMQDAAAAISLLVDGFELPEEGKGLTAVVNAAQIVAQVLCQTGNPISGLALAKLLPAFMSSDEDLTVFLRDLISSVSLPAPLKGLRFNPYSPEYFTAKTEYDVLAAWVATGRWKKALTHLEKLVENAESWPGVFMSLAMLQLWLGRMEDAFATLRKFAGMSGVSQEDQGDAMALVYMIDRRNLRDEVDIVRWEATINDYDRALERMLSTPRLQSVDFDPRRFATGDEPGPKRVFMVLDKPFAPDDVPPALDNVPRQLATIFMFGKQTDREARLEITETLATNRESVMSLLVEALQDALGEVREPVATRTVSETLAQIDGRLRFKNSNPPTPEQAEQILQAYISEGGTLQTWWLHRSLNELDGKTPLEAASDPKYRPRLLGMIEMIEFLLPPQHALEATNALRRSLGFETLGPVTLPEADAELALSQLPVTRWHRVDTTPISNESLAGELAMLDLISEERGTLHFAKAVLERPLREIDPQIRGLAFRVLIDDAEDRDDYENAMLWIDRARNESRELNFSSAEWDVAELMVRIKQRNQPEAMRLVDYIMRHHKNDPRAMSAMQSLFVQMGLLNPDGTPTAFARQQPRQMRPDGVTSSATFAEPPMTPPMTMTDTPKDVPAADGNAKKLWVPD
ncbi:MAG: hypothetical protein FWC50_13175 [Planctomycetaceae bacterium]|nr:hypothetical protein [Planctomycetaceae bacterium]